jgi:hypothetical protein
MMTMLRTTVSSWIGQPRKIALKKVFDQPGRFESIHAAYYWCRAEGFSVGEMQSGSPSGLKRGDWRIEKWRNLDRDDLAKLDGLMVEVKDIEDPFEFKLGGEGPVVVILFEPTG